MDRVNATNDQRINMHEQDSGCILRMRTHAPVRRGTDVHSFGEVLQLQRVNHGRIPLPKHSITDHASGRVICTPRWSLRREIIAVSTTVGNPKRGLWARASCNDCWSESRWAVRRARSVETAQVSVCKLLRLSACVASGGGEPPPPPPPPQNVQTRTTS
jgi:hypothetical protein